MQITVASYNIHKAVGTDRKRDPARILNVLREIDADVIALQEADMRFGQRASVLQRAALDDTPWKVVPVAKRPRSIGWHGNALLVRREMNVLDSEALDLPMLEPRGAACADIGNGSGAFRVVGAHLDLSGVRRSDQIRAILDHLHRAHPDMPEIMLGDFNQWSARSGAMRQFDENWLALSPGPSFPSGRPIARLDRLVFSPHWKLLNHGVHHSALASRASDHLPVWATVRLPNL
ncbi:endonuclease/exonuclease/phosphatase family protein [Parerythrobacter jejuensis]|uniref:Endonuclease n=1 Tax=Parerythrobacter jejuensis TaxID=795812 RepID=A0A845AWK8_9SPHN|nr:endonuclease/exonuclease/phosphatase family protein [Parerythrobacter jejuensis]MXP30785.1 endonuclease [Parerythrobacter jejuensis]MXP33545.1 endonuclease [Parerythrobacter jejuensis]